MRIHEELVRLGVPDGAALLQPAQLDGASGRDLAAFREWLYQQISGSADSPAQQRFLKRWPTVQSFDSLAFRELLAFNTSPRGRIWGIERSSRAGADARRLLSASASAPDRDGRNRGRVLYDRQTKKALRDGKGNLIPFDPATLNMGKISGLSSQAHAHYGLPQVEFSDSPDVLKDDPVRFAVNAGWSDGPLLTLAAEMTQMHTDLAILADLWGGTGSRYLTVMYAGHSWHYLQDVGNQIHTVQVGLYDFFVDAKIQYWWRAFVTSGGYLAPLEKFTSVGIGILRNYHVLIEQLTAVRFDEAISGSSTASAMKDVLATLQSDDADFRATLEPAVASSASGFGEAITRALIETSAPEGPEAYRLAREVGCGRLKSYGYRLPDDTDKVEIHIDTLVCSPNAPELEALYGLQVKAFARVGTAMRAYDRALAATLARPDKAALKTEVLNRFVTARLDLLDAADTRRAAWMANPPADDKGGHKDWAWPLGQTVVFGLLGFLIWRRLVRETPMFDEVPPPVETKA